MEENLMTNEVDTELDTSSVENEGVAEPQVSEDEGVEATENNSEEQTQNEKPVDVNAIAAAARRKAEQEAKSAQAAIDAEYVRRFGDLKNPKTGEPIRSQADYLKALDAQEELRTQEELKSKGIDPNIINNAIANNPLIRQAQAVIEQNKMQQTFTQINADVAEIGKLEPSIKSLEDVPPDVIKMSLDSKGAINLVNAYKILNYGKVSEAKQAAITQNVINQAKGKSHLAPTEGGGATTDGLREIPSSELAKWKAFFPDASTKELRQKYNRVVKERN